MPTAWTAGAARQPPRRSSPTDPTLPLLTCDVDGSMVYLLDPALITGDRGGERGRRARLGHRPTGPSSHAHRRRADSLVGMDGHAHRRAWPRPVAGRLVLTAPSGAVGDHRPDHADQRQPDRSDRPRISPTGSRSAGSGCATQIDARRRSSADRDRLAGTSRGQKPRYIMRCPAAAGNRPVHDGDRSDRTPASRCAIDSGSASSSRRQRWSDNTHYQLSPTPTRRSCDCSRRTSIDMPSCRRMR